jgi:exopolysaccharide production protein ExoZ
MKLYSVQYLRGLAAFLVVVAHALQHPIPYGSNWDYIRLGSLGVLMFFVISGFIMVMITGDGPFAPATFLKRRAIRVIPLYWLATLAVAAIAIVAPQVLKTTVYSTPHLILSLLFIPHAAPEGGISPLLKLGWTLNFEIFFYLAFACLAWADAMTRVIALTIVLGTLIAVGTAFHFDIPILDFYTGFVLIGFVIGAWIGLAVVKGVSFNQPVWLVPLAVIAVVGLVGGFLLERGTRGGDLVTLSLTIGSAALLMILLGVEKRIPHLRLPALLGDASYSIYLVHLYFVAGAMMLVHRMHGIPMPLATIVTVIVATAAGIATHFLVERPLLRRMQRPARRAAPAPDAALPLPVDGLSPALENDDGTPRSPFSPTSPGA